MPTPSVPYHQSLKLTDFTAFGDTEFNFVPGVNAIIGANGTGKTHFLKALYAWQSATWRSQQEGESGPPKLAESFAAVFQTEDEDELIRGHGVWAKLYGHFGGKDWGCSFFGKHVGHNREDPGSRAHPALKPVSAPVPEPVFIPAIDMMGHTKGFVSTYDRYRIDFDETHRMIVSLLLLPERRTLDPQQQAMIEALGALLRGDLVLEGERFYLYGPEGKLPVTMIGEGLRKIATLIRLIQVGALGPGSTLFWDEPEVNLNPSYMDELITAIFTLSRWGVQVFLATHSYVILKELDVQMKADDSVRFFALAPSKTGTKVTEADELSQLHPNAILDQYGSLLDRDLERATGRKPSRDR